MNVTIGIIGVISGLLCAAADTPLGYFFPEDNHKIGKKKDIMTGWANVSVKRYYLSFFLSFLGQPGCYLVFRNLAEIIGKSDLTMGTTLKICTFLGCYTGIITHAVFCIKPLIYHHIHNEAKLETAEKVLHEIDRIMLAPIIVCSVTLVLIPTFLISAAILNGTLSVSKLWIIPNPLVLMAVIMSIKKLFPKIPLIGFMGTSFAVYALILISAA